MLTDESLSLIIQIHSHVFKMENKTSFESVTLFDRLPTEIIYLVFEYLSTNDILYTFFHFNDRFNNLLLQNQRYSTYFELPTTNFDKWRKIIPLISSQIECLNINTIYLTFPLKSFPNLKSIIISSRYGFADEELQSIIENEQFQRLESFRIKDNRRSFIINSNEYFNHSEILNKVFTNKTSLKIFVYSSILRPLELMDMKHFETNDKLRSLGLVLNDYEDIFSLLEYTPNLKHLNIQSKTLLSSEKSIKELNLKLERFDLKLSRNKLVVLPMYDKSINFDELINSIKPFSSSLICLSINLSDLGLLLDFTGSYSFFTSKIPFNILTLQQWLESMTKLKQFNFYTKLTSHLKIDKEIILTEFKNRYWLDHNWSFGMHGKYLYTLPFYFDHLHQFPNGSETIKLNNSRLWYNVQSMGLSIAQQYDINLIRDIKMKIPNLNIIEFPVWPFVRSQVSFRSNDKRYDTENILNKLTTIHFSAFHECERELLLNSLSNLRDLIYSSQELSTIEFSLNAFGFNRTNQMENDVYSILKLLEDINEVYFSNIKHITICLNNEWSLTHSSQKILFKILKQFKHLETFLIFISTNFEDNELHLVEENIFKFLYRLRMNKHLENYEIKYFHRYFLISLLK